MSGLTKYFKSLFKNGGAKKIYAAIAKKVDARDPGQTAWANRDVRVDVGEVRGDGSQNLAWQRQAGTKHPELKKYSTHDKLVVQRHDPKNPRSAEDMSQELISLARSNQQNADDV